MQRPHLSAWLRPALIALGLTGVLSLGACGGGSGAVNAPVETPVTPSAIQVLPASQTIYPGTVASISVSGGVPPYTAFSSNSAVLPVGSAVPTSTNQVLLAANSVSATTGVTITIKDSASQTATASVTVAPAQLFPNGLTVTATQSTCGSATLCTGGTGTVKVTATGAGGSALSGRQIRFDVVYGAFGFISTNPATPLVQTITVTTDVAGVAQVGIEALVDVDTQPAQVRATDLTSGQAQVANFTIVRNQDGSSIITVVPSTATITGPDSATCSTGVAVDYRVFGGTPPYHVTASFPQAISIVNSTVANAGDAFEVITNGSCVDPLTFSIVDAAGRQTTATISNKVGTATPPTALSITPTTQGSLTTTCNPGGTYQIAISGANPSYAITNTRPTNGLSPIYTSILSAPGTLSITNIGFPSSDTTSTGTYTFTITSSDGQVAKSLILCGTN